MVMPTPERTKTMGRMAGSAPGASHLMEMCAARNARQSAMGTPRVERLTSSPAFMTYRA